MIHRFRPAPSATDHAPPQCALSYPPTPAPPTLPPLAFYYSPPTICNTFTDPEPLHPSREAYYFLFTPIDSALSLLTIWLSTSMYQRQRISPVGPDGKGSGRICAICACPGRRGVCIAEVTSILSTICKPSSRTRSTFDPSIYSAA